MIKFLLSTFFFAVILFGLNSCDRKEEKKIILERGKTILKKSNDAKVRIAIGGMTTPKEGVVYYRDLLNYIQGEIGETIEYVDRESYAEINEMLRTDKLEAAFVCSGPYIDGREKFGLELLAAPQAYGSTVYYSYILTGKDSPIKSFEELRGKKFAFTDPLSNTGTLVPTYMLAKMNETPEKFFRKVIFTNSHDKSIKAVAQKIVDGAAVDSLIWEYLNATNPEYTSKTRILTKSPPYAIPPVVVPQNLDPALKDKMRKAFLNTHLDPKGQAILKKMKIDKFVEIDDSAYKSVREMKEWLMNKNREK